MGKFIILYIYLITFAKCAFVIDKFESTCDLRYLKNLTVSSKDWEVYYNKVAIKFNLCGHLDDKYQNKYIAYIKNVNGTLTAFDQITVTLDDKLDFRAAIGDTNCKLSVQFVCLMYTKEPKVKVNNKCDYEISIFSPFSTCFRPYGMLYHNELLDFRPLQRAYHVHDKDKKFEACISFCNKQENCDPPKQFCDINVKNITVQFEQITYNKEKFEVDTYYFENNKKIKMKVQLICNWFKDPTELKLLYKGTKTNTFEIESSLGCIKQPPACKITDKNFIYDLSSLHKPNGYWEIQNLNGTRTINLNVCGPLLIQDNCSRSHSQVCEIEDGKYVSRGRINSPLEPEILEDSVVIRFTNGDVCTENRTYSTRIEFVCSSVDERPTFEEEENCELLIRWNTIKACPKYNPQSCSGKLQKSKSYDCEYRNVQEDYYKLYNLKGLYDSKGYVIKGKKENYEYRLNVCGPIDIPEAPCKRNVMVAKIFPEEPNDKKKVISFGEQTNISLNNQFLIMETSGGDFYRNEGEFGYRKAKIRFECNESVETEIVVQSETDNSLEFLWKTKHACFIFKDTSRSCFFNIDQNNVLDLKHLRKDSLFVQFEANNAYLFDLCGHTDNNEIKELCNPKNCTYVKASNDTVNYDNKPHIEFLLNEPCNSRQKYNRSLVELICDEFIGNDHFNKDMRVENCTLMLQFLTSKACRNENVVVPIESYDVQQVNYDLSDSNKNVVDKIVEKGRDCMLISPNTNYKFNISELKLDVNTDRCPENSFNFDNRTVTLFYNVPKSCHHSKDNLELTVVLKCEEFQKNRTEQFRCSKKMTFFLPVACKLLEMVNSKKIEDGSVSGGLITAYTLLSILLFSLLFSAIYWIYKRRFRRCPYDPISIPYHKDADN